MPERILLFVCAHGAGKSRMAAALFNAVAPDGWRAVSAGQHPAPAVNDAAMRLIAATTAAPHFDRDPPRTIDAVATPARIVTLDCDVDGSERWDLVNAQIAEPMREEIQHRAEALARSLGGGS